MKVYPLKSISIEEAMNKIKEAIDRYIEEEE